MQDRVPLYPGRVKMTPVAGQANTYDMVRADDPTQAGTPLNKATLLKDTTAALFGLGTDAVPDDVLNKLSKGVLAQPAGKYTKHTISFSHLAVGDTVQLSVDGASKEFLVVHKGLPSSLYDNSCNGIWLLMKDIYESREWNSSNSNKYKLSTINSYLNSAFLSLLNSDIQEAIKQVKIPYLEGNGNTGHVNSGGNGMSVKVFLLSGYEVGFTTSYTSYLPADGAKLDYFVAESGGDPKRIAYLDGSAATWWLRSPGTSDALSAYDVRSDGGPYMRNPSKSSGIRPAFILPADYQYIYYTDDSGNIYTEQEYETALTDVLGAKLSIPASQIQDGVKIETGSYVGTGTYGADNPNTLTFGFVPKLVFIFGFYPTNDPHPNGYNGTFDVTSLNEEYKKYGYLINDWSNVSDSSHAKMSGHTLSWYSSSSNNSQLNSNGAHYSYIAIG